MDAMKRQASKLREHVAKQQQDLRRHLANEAVDLDDDQLQSRQKLQTLCKSTRAAKHFQRGVVRGVEGYISAWKKEIEIGRKLAEDCLKFANVSQSSGSPLATGALHFGSSRDSIENEKENMLRILGAQVSEPLRASITGAPLEDARHLTHRYERLCHEVESRAAEVTRRKSKCRDPSAESDIKLRSAEAKLTDLRSRMVALEREATAAMLSVEDQQQHITFQKLLTALEAERSYHQNVDKILEKLHAEMTGKLQLKESSLQSVTMQSDVHNRPVHGDSRSGSDDQKNGDHNNTYFVAKVIHPFDAETDGELSLATGDYVVVRQVADGWAEGECNGKAGWFPSAYIETQDQPPASKTNEVNESA